jgi:hypothetical protein
VVTGPEFFLFAPGLFGLLPGSSHTEVGVRRDSFIASWTFLRESPDQGPGPQERCSGHDADANEAEVTVSHEFIRVIKLLFGPRLVFPLP